MNEKLIKLITKQGNMYFMNAGGDIESITDPQMSNTETFVKVLDGEEEVYLRASEIVEIRKR